MASLSGPRFLPLGWKPKVTKKVIKKKNKLIFLFKKNKTIKNSLITFINYNCHLQEQETEKFLQFCTVCKGFKAPRSHHCRKCKLITLFD